MMQKEVPIMGRVVVPIGTQHPALKEPASFILTLEGEKVVSAKAKLGYNHRGIEKACENRSYIQSLYIVERVCGICSHAHSTVYCEAVEELAGIEIPKRAKYLRTVVCELERLHSHLLWLGVAAHEIGFDTFFMYVWRDREKVMDILENFCGNRVNYGINTLGGVRRDLTPEIIEDIKNLCKLMDERLKIYTDLAMGDATLAGRLAKVGRLSKETAIQYGAVGPVARASGVAIDVRVNDPFAAYDEVKANIVVDDNCDVFGRVLVRVLEMVDSVRMLRFMMDNIPDGTISVKVPRKIPAGEVAHRVEAPRGEDAYFLASNGTEKPERIRMRAPTEANWHAIAHMLEGDYLADSPIIIAAIDPCYSCTDRAIQINDLNTGKQDILNWQQLKQYSINWHRENNGIDFAKLKIK